MKLPLSVLAIACVSLASAQVVFGSYTAQRQSVSDSALIAMGDCNALGSGQTANDLSFSLAWSWWTLPTEPGNHALTGSGGINGLVSYLGTVPPAHVVKLTWPVQWVASTVNLALVDDNFGSCYGTDTVTSNGSVSVSYTCGKVTHIGSTYGATFTALYTTIDTLAGYCDGAAATAGVVLSASSPSFVVVTQ